jgi:hypothetical protein
MLVAGTTTSPGLIGGLAAAIGVPLVLALLRKLRAYRYPGKTTVQTEEQAQNYRKWNLVAGLLLLSYAYASGYVCWLLLCAIESKRAVLLGSADFVLIPSRIFFAIPSLFTGLLFAAVPLRLTLSGILGREGYGELVEYGNRKQRINGKRVFQHQVFVLAPLIIVAVALAFQNYALVSEHGLVIHPYFAMHERTYGWEDVKRIAFTRSFKAPSGKVRRDRPYYVLEMADGYQLNFHRTLLEIPLPDQTRLATFVAEHAHLSVETDDPYP